MPHPLRAAGWAAVGLALVAAGCRKAPPPPQVTIGGRTWTVELATTAQQRYQGLSGRGELAEGVGMLFIYPRAQMLEFCMRRCRAPLDVAFVGPDMRVVATYTMVVDADPARGASYSSMAPAQFVLEARAGSIRKSVRVGDRVVFNQAVPDPAKAEPGR